MLKKLVISGILVMSLGISYGQKRPDGPKIKSRDSVVVNLDSVQTISIQDVQKSLQIIQENDKILLKDYNTVLRAYQLLIQIADERRKKKA